MTLLGRGMVLAGVARQLDISTNTAKEYARRARLKLGAATRTEAVLIHGRRAHRRCAAVAAGVTR